MEAIDLVLKIWGIKKEYRTETEEVLRTSPPEHLGLSLAMLGQPTDAADSDCEADLWMQAYLPELRLD